MIIEELYLKANFIINPLLQPTLKSKNVLKNEIIKRAINDGIYFITDEENANKIIEESLIQSPEPFPSFGLKKSVFYGGIPEFSVACLDLKLPSVLIAIKLEISYETLALFQIETNQMAYKLFYPNLLTMPKDLKKVYLGLTSEDAKFCYKEITEEQALDYVAQIPVSEIKLIEKKLAQELKEKLKILKKIKNQIQK